MTNEYQIPQLDLIPQALLTYEVSTRHNSTLVKKGNGVVDYKEATPVNTSRRRFIPVTSKVVINTDGITMDAQYVPGQPTIFLNDYVDHKGIKQKGLRSLGVDLKEAYGQAMKKPLYFDERGFLEVGKYHPDQALVYFLMTHPYNDDAPFKNPAIGVVNFLKFKQVKKDVQQKKAEDNFLLRDSIMKEVFSLYTETNGGISYNEVKISAIAKILGIDGKHPNMVDRYGYIRHFAESNAKEYGQSIAKGLSDVKIDLAKASQYKIITIGKSDAKILREGKLISICQVTSAEAGMDEVAYWMLGAEGGSKVLNEIIDSIRTAQIVSASPVKA